MKIFTKVAVVLIVLMMLFLAGCTDNEKAMVEAVQKGDTPMVQSLLDKGVSPNLKTDDGKTILMLAAHLGHTEIAKVLIEKGAEVDARDNSGKTALMYAAQTGNIDMAKLLLESGADLNATDASGQTALQIAQANHQIEMVEFLTNWGKTVSTVTPVETPVPTATGTPIPISTPVVTPTPKPTVTPIPIVTGTPIPTQIVSANQQLASIFFAFDKSVLGSDQTATMEDILATVRANPGLYIILAGHADDRGTSEYNRTLSIRRAKTIEKYLTGNGIDSEMIITYGFGKDHPLKMGHDETSRSYNRRVDVLLGDSVLTKEQTLAETLN